MEVMRVHDFLYKGFKVMNLSDSWAIMNLDRHEWPIGEVVEELEKDLWPTEEDVKSYINTYLLGIF